jgi:hypothetical protein
MTDAPAIPTLRSPEQFRVDVAQRLLADLPPAELPLIHRFTPGLYSREIFMPKGTMIVSRVHKTEHPYAVLQGKALVWCPDAEDAEVLAAGHIGITMAGTRRVLYILEDCRWVTFHPTKETDLAKLQDELTETPDVSYLDSAAPEELERVRALLLEFGNRKEPIA